MNLAMVAFQELLYSACSFLVFFIPLIYALAKFKAYRLSAKILFTPYILSFAIIGGLYILVKKFGSNITIPLIHKTVSIDMIAIISCGLIFLLWIFPAIYTYRKSKLVN